LNSNNEETAHEDFQNDRQPVAGSRASIDAGLPAAAANPKPAPNPAPAAKPAPTPVPPEKHPQIHEALESLRNSKEHLEHAAHDFGGHRVEAIKAIDQAIHQLEICLQYDKD
jgi:hypothetical protein